MKQQLATQDYIKTNFQGTYNIVRYCDRKNIPLIYAGSSSHHSGKFKNPEPVVIQKEHL